MKYFKTTILIVLAALVINSGFSCKWNPFRQDKELYEDITLEYWGVWDTPSQLRSLIDEYEKDHPTIKVNYRNFRYDEYERKLLEAWADDRGPDVFAIPASWLKAYQHRLAPMPASHKIPVYETQGTLKKELVTVLKEFKGLSPQDVKLKYAPVVYQNVVLDNQVYGLPYSVDTLATFYNLDLLTLSGIAEPIQDFYDLVEQAPRLTKATEGNRIVQSAVALGGTDNIPRFFDVFSSIMMQNGVQAKGNYFRPLDDDQSAQRLAQVFGFYTDFARPGKASYSWNSDLEDAFEMFATGRLAYFFGYSYHAQDLRERGVQFDWGLTNFPQTQGSQGSIYYANYWVNVVPAKSKNVNAAWNFVQSTASEGKVGVYLQDNKRPTALRALIDNQLNDYEIAPFASQVLTADNWYNGYNFPLAEEYLADTIEQLVSGELVLDEKGAALQNFVAKINQTYTKP